MSERLDQATMEQPAQAGIMNRIYEAAREHPVIAKIAVGVGMLGAGGAAELAVADAAVAQPTAEASSTSSWTVLGGDPLVPGGVHSRSEFVHVITSGKGQTAMKYAGLGTKERQAITLATREGEERSCNMPYGEHFERMSFGINGTSVDRDVTFADPDYINNPAPAFCVDAKVDVNGDGKIDEVVHIKMPEKCGNIALMNRTPVHHPKKRHPKPHHPQAPVFGGKVAKDGVNGNVITPFPTHIFQEEIVCKVGRNTIDKKVPMMHPVEFLANCNVGSVAKISETVLVGPQDWNAETPTTQYVKVHAKSKRRNIATFVNRQVLHTPPPTCEELGTCITVTPPNHPPVGELRPPLHEFVNDNEPVCTEGISDPDGDPVSIVDIKLTDPNGNPFGNVVGSVYDNGPGIKCFKVHAPSTPGEMTITETLTDGKGGNTVLSDTMPIVPDQF